MEKGSISIFPLLFYISIKDDDDDELDDDDDELDDDDDELDDDDDELDDDDVDEDEDYYSFLSIGNGLSFEDLLNASISISIYSVVGYL